VRTTANKTRVTSCRFCKKKKKEEGRTALSYLDVLGNSYFPSKKERKEKKEGRKNNIYSGEKKVNTDIQFAPAARAEEEKSAHTAYDQSCPFLLFEKEGKRRKEGGGSLPLRRRDILFLTAGSFMPPASFRKGGEREGEERPSILE